MNTVRSDSRDLSGLTSTERGTRQYASMLTIRRFEERVLALRMIEEIQGSVHLCIGQEAVPVAACGALRSDDPVYATYRGHGWALAAGAPLTELFAEMLGRATGVNAGRGGSAYLSHRASSFMGENSIVGASVPIALGAALAARHQGTGRVALTVFGDGATSQGSVHEALNMAAAFRLPVVFMCENNVYSELTPIADMVGEAVLHQRAASYGMASIRIDGNDAHAVHAAVADAADRARAGHGPTFVEAMTYRLCGHYIGDPETYRTPDEVDEARTLEPLVVARRTLAEAGVTDVAITAIEADVEALVADAESTALAAPPADPATVMDHLYA
jgi:TPP-dependent pyruvate/acetoin dehydrogenase alpha subunit